MKKLYISAAVLIASVANVMAADLIVDAPSVAEVYSPAYDWTGVYVGGALGYGVGTVDVTDTSGDFFDEGPGESFDVDAAGIVGNLAVGANWQAGSLVFGVEGQLGYLGASDERYVIDSPDNFGEVEFGAYADVTARLGLAVDQTLFYLKGGVAGADVSGRFGDLLDSGVPDSGSNGAFSDWAFGWTAGAGVEYALDDNWSAKVEYQYYDLGTEDLMDTEGDMAEADITAQVVKFGLNYRF